jgi:hypothetical protein
MKLRDYKIIFIAVALVGVLIIASLAIANFIHAPAGEAFFRALPVGARSDGFKLPLQRGSGPELLCLRGCGEPFGLFSQLCVIREACQLN